MYVEQLRRLSTIPCSKPIHLPPTHFVFLEEGVFLAKMINKSGFVCSIFNTREGVGCSYSNTLFFVFL